jgi:hypothetical protein
MLYVKDRDTLERPHDSLYVAKREVLPELYTKALGYASEAMDILEFRLETKWRDGRSGLHPSPWLIG